MSVALVDVDGTITCKNISFLFGRYLYDTKRMSLFQAFICGCLYGCHRIGLIETAALHHGIFNLVFRGKNRSDFIALAEVFFDLYGRSFFRPDMIKELAALGKKQITVILLSSSPDFLVALVAKALGGLEYQATEYLCTSNDLFSSVGIVMSGSQKARTADEYRKKGIGYIFAYTDSLQDQPLLEVVDEVVAVFPQKALEKMAIKRGWRIVQD